MGVFAGPWLQRLAAVLTLVVGPAMTSQAADTTPLNPPVKVRMNAAGIAGEGGFFIALDRGYFSTEGLDIEIVPGSAANAGMDTVAQLIADDLNVATLAPGAGLFNALARNVGITGIYAVNTITKNDPSTGIIVRQDHLASGRYKSPADLKGMKIAVLTLGGTGHYNVKKALEIGGLKDSDVELVTMSFPDALVALGNKIIDGAFEVEPFISIAKARNIAAMKIPASDTTLGLPTIMWYANTAFIKKNEEAVRRLIFAAMRGQKDYALARSGAAGAEDLYRSLQKYTAMKDMALIKQIALPFADPAGGFDEAGVADLQNFFILSKTMQKPLPVGQIIDRSFAEAASKRMAGSN